MGFGLILGRKLALFTLREKVTGCPRTLRPPPQERNRKTAAGRALSPGAAPSERAGEAGGSGEPRQRWNWSVVCHWNPGDYSTK